MNGSEREEGPAATEGALGEQRAARELRRLRVLLEAMPVAMFYKDTEGRYLGCNPAFESLLGRTEAEIVGRTVEEIWPADLARVYREADDALFAAGGTQVYEARLRAADGSPRDVIFHKAVFQESGRTAGLVGSILDITARKDAERALAVSDRKFHAAFHQAGLAMALFDEEGRFLDMSPMVLRVSGYSEAELRGTRIVDHAHPDCREELRAAFAGLVDGSLDDSDSRPGFLRKNGKVAQVRLQLSAVRDEQRRFQFAVAFAEDVTEKLRLESRLQGADRLAALGTLAAGVAHEINNPLTYIVSNLHFVREAIGDRAEPEVAEALSEASEGTERVSRIVQDLRSFSRADDTLTAVDVGAVLRSAANLAHSEIRKRARLALELCKLPPVLGNASRLGQVFLNLLLNAAQAMPERPHEQNEVRVTARATGTQVVVEVRDNGVGIPPSIRTRIFDPFFTTKSAGVGTGLGLAICQRIVTGLGGEIEIESEEGVGTVARVALLVAHERALSKLGALEERAEPAGRELRVLVVDDEPAICRMLERVLRPYEVAAEVSALAALKRLRRGEDYDILLCDLVMPDMSGVEFFQALRASRPELATRTVFMTGGTSSPELDEFLRSVENRRVLKPFEAAELRQVLCSVARGERPTTPK